MPSQRLPPPAPLAWAARTMSSGLGVLKAFVLSYPLQLVYGTGNNSIVDRGALVEPHSVAANVEATARSAGRSTTIAGRGASGSSVVGVDGASG